MRRGDTYCVVAVDQETRTVTIGVDVQRDTTTVQSVAGSSYVVRHTPVSSRRLRLPFGIRPTFDQIKTVTTFNLFRWPMLVRRQWSCTSTQVKRGTLAEAQQSAARHRYGYEVQSPSDPKRSVWRKGTPYSRAVVEGYLAGVRALSMRKNPRQGWRPDGTEIVA